MSHAAEGFAAYFSPRNLAMLFATATIILLTGCNSDNEATAVAPEPATGDVYLSAAGNTFFVLSNEEETVYTQHVSLLTGPNSNKLITRDGYSMVGFDPDEQHHTAGYERPFTTCCGPVPPVATTAVQLQINLDETASQPIQPTFSPIDSSSYNWTTSIDVYDSLGAQHTLTIYFVRSAMIGSWSARFYIDGVPVGGSSLLSFGLSGQIVVPANGLLNPGAFTPTTGAFPLNITVDLSSCTQQATPFSKIAASQNGRTEEMAEITSITEDGRIWITTTYSHTTFEASRLALAQFHNPTGLRADQNGRYHTSIFSGPAELGVPSENNFPFITVAQ